MPQFNQQTVTPGSAVAATIQEILARRRAEEQQMLMTRLQMDETAETKRARAEQERMVREQFTLQQQASERDKAQAEVQNKLLNQQLIGAEKAMLTPGMRPEDVPDLERRERLTGAGVFPMFQSQGPTEEGGILPVQLGAYPGTYEQQQDAERKQVLQGLGEIARMPNGPEKDAALAEAAGTALSQGVSIPSLIERAFGQPKVQGGYLSEGQFVPLDGIMVDPKDAVMGNAGWEPRMPVGAMDRPRTYKIYDVDTNKLVETKPNMTQVDLEQYLTEQATAGKRLYPVDILGKQPEAGTVPAALSGKLASARAAFMQSAQAAKPGFFSFGTDDKAVGLANAAGAQYSTLVGQAMQHVDAPQHVKDLANLIMSDPQVYNLPVQNAFRVLAERPETHPRRVGSKSGQISPDDAIAVQNLINLFQGLQTVPVPAAPIYQFAPTQ